MLYHFVRSAALVSRKADELDRKDSSGESLRRAFSSTVGLGDEDRSAVFGLALELDAQFAALDQQAATIIANAKAGRTPGGVVPPPPPELAALQQQKVALMNTLASTLNQRLSSTAKGAIVNYFNHSRAKGNSSPAGTVSAVSGSAVSQPQFIPGVTTRYSDDALQLDGYTLSGDTVYNDCHLTDNVVTGTIAANAAVNGGGLGIVSAELYGNATN